MRAFTRILRETLQNVNFELLQRSAFGILLLVSLSAAQLHGQSLSDLKAAHPNGVETTLVANAFIFDAPTDSGTPIGRFDKGKQVFVYKREGSFYAAATEDKGFVGYILVNRVEVAGSEDADVVSPLQFSLYRDPARARNLSLVVPGGGQFYAGNNEKGTIILLTSLASFIGGYARTLSTKETICGEVPPCMQEIDNTGLITGSAIAVAIWGFGVLTAAGDARKSNDRTGAQPRVSVAPQLNRSGLGLAARFVW